MYILIYHNSNKQQKKINILQFSTQMYYGEVFWFCLFDCCLFSFFFFLTSKVCGGIFCFLFLVVAEIFTILVMLMPNVTKFNLFRPQALQKNFVWLNPLLIWHPTVALLIWHPTVESVWAGGWMYSHRKACRTELTLIYTT